MKSKCVIYELKVHFILAPSPLMGEGWGEGECMGNLKPLARKLRKNATDTENLLWKSLRSKRMGGLKFRRQVPIGPYILDFVCLAKRIIVECDGGQHMEQRERDEKRDRWFLNQGYRVLRFWDNQVLQSLEIVLEEIYTACMNSPHPNPLPQGERE